MSIPRSASIIALLPVNKWREVLRQQRFLPGDKGICEKRFNSGAPTENLATSRKWHGVTEITKWRTKVHSPSTRGLDSGGVEPRRERLHVLEFPQILSRLDPSFRTLL